MSGLKVPMQELLEYNRDHKWLKKGVDKADVAFSRVSGMDAEDVATFRNFTLQEVLLIVVRCPKLSARIWHGHAAPKPLAVKDKTGSSGLVVTNKGKVFVSDYDLMSVWDVRTGKPSKISVSARDGLARGEWSARARQVVVELNKRLISRIQHGCQDDYNSAGNPGVKPGDHFAVFRAGVAEHLPTSAACAAYYRRLGLKWPYDEAGKYKN